MLDDRQGVNTIVKNTQLMIKSFLLVDIWLMIASTGLILIPLFCHQTYADRIKLLLFGSSLGGLSCISALCNSLVSHGIHVWKRVLLVPWIVLHTSILLFLLVLLACYLYYNTAQIYLIILLTGIGNVSIFNIFYIISKFDFSWSF